MTAGPHVVVKHRSPNRRPLRLPDQPRPKIRDHGAGRWTREQARAVAKAAKAAKGRKP